MRLKNWKLFELILLLFFISIAIFMTCYTRDSILNFIVILTGILCVVLAAKGNLWTYIFGTINTVTYAYVAYRNGLFGEVGLNLLFFLPTNIVGYILWKRKMDGNTVRMRGLSLSRTLWVILICIVGISVLGFLLSLIKTQNTPYVDAATNVLSIVATLLMIWRYREQWLLYISINLLSIVMWYIRYLNGSHDGMMMTLMWFAYLINAVYGYINWSRHAVKTTEEGEAE